MSEKSNEEKNIKDNTHYYYQNISQCEETYSLQHHQTRREQRNHDKQNSPVVKRQIIQLLESFGESQNLTDSEQVQEISETSVLMKNKKITYAKSTPRNTEYEFISGDSNESKAESVKHDHNCSENCTCNQTLTEVESLPMHFIADRRSANRSKIAKSPLKKHIIKGPEQKTRCTDVVQQQFSCECLCREMKRNQSCDRYNYNHIQIRRDGEKKKRSFKLFKKKKYKEKNMAKYGKPLKYSDSGDTFPQLYKAKVKNSINIPEIFTFRATEKLISNPKKNKYLNNRKCQHDYDFTVLDRSGKSAKFPSKQEEAPNPSPQLEEEDYHNKDEESTGKEIAKYPKRVNDFPNLRAALNFDGTEYITTTELPRRIDIYCFDHLNTSYFRTTDQPPPLSTDLAIQKAEEIATRFWAEVFGIIHFILAFVIALVLQLFKLVLCGLVRPLTSGLLQLASDYLLKPLLTTLYNGFTQPLLVFLFNVAASLRDVCHPLARAVGYFISEAAVLLGSIRLAEWRTEHPAALRPVMKDSSC